ncbi:hypothetical protein DXG03_009188 [Asterophora parasitica]|uniref:DUF3533 domain-containing protein n=1 Tax=Asterophora parasitica TaxID=117018 RepID=A0A9P7KA00_9AGAR|nr:hypothetical protein DXG03_009188 [Asterophora parasitica]
MNAIQLFAASTPNATALIATSPQTIVQPLFYGVDNVAPFNEPVCVCRASAVTFVGLIYSVILAFFVVMICYGAREHSGINRNLTLRSLIITRYVTYFVAIFFVALFYSLLTLAFRLDFTRKFGHRGFLIFWMVNWAGMLAVGLALESLITLFTSRFIPFFMLLWIIVGQNFGILIAWGAISCITLPLVQWYVRRGDVAAERQAQEQQRLAQEKFKQEQEKQQGNLASVYTPSPGQEKDLTTQPPVQPRLEDGDARGRERDVPGGSGSGNSEST